MPISIFPTPSLVSIVSFSECWRVRPAPGWVLERSHYEDIEIEFKRVGFNLDEVLYSECAAN